VIDDLAAMTKAAAAAGTPIAVQSAYRSYATQVTTFQYWVNLDGYARALLYSARPGHSEHQLGVAIDFKSAAGGPPWSGSDWALSPAGSWMKANAWQYGFILSYPKGERSKTCYDYEAWHYRYVGREEAAAIHASGLTTREYLWRHFTTVDLDIGTPQGPSPSPAAPASPSPHPTATATTQPSDGPSNLPSLAPTSAPTTPAPIESSTPIDVPTGSQVTFLGLDAATAAISGGLVILLIALVFSVGMARRRHGSSDPPGPGLKG
jgi:D-alanyl-D-alanine carboxypeptidase